VFQHHQDEAADESSAPISAISERTLTKSEETIKVMAKLAQNELIKIFHSSNERVNQIQINLDLIWQCF